MYQYLKDNGDIYYVGKGSKSRYRESHSDVTVPKKTNIQFVETNMSEDDAYTLEEQLTRRYGLLIEGTGLLENKVHGGKSSHIPSFTGYKHTEKTKQLISEKNKGKIRTAKHKANYSKPKTAEHAENIRKANLGRKDSADKRKNISEAMKKVVARKKQQGIRWKEKTPNSHKGDS